MHLAEGGAEAGTRSKYKYAKADTTYPCPYPGPESLGRPWLT